MRELMDRAVEAVAACLDTAVWPRTDAEAAGLVDAGHLLETLGRAVTLRGVRAAERLGLPAAHRAPSIRTWLRDRLQISPAEAGRLVRQAAAVEADPRLDAALSAGELSPEQLSMIVDSLRALPADLSPQLRDHATELLLDLSAQLDPVALRRAGQRILAHLAPQVQDAADKAALERAERAAHERRAFTLTPTGDGRFRLHGLLDAEAAAVVTAALDPLCSPDAVTGELAASGDARTPAQRRADALVDLCRGGAVIGPPDQQVAVTIDYDALIGKLGAGLLDSGDVISAEAARRLACDARIMPFVLGGAGQVLDAGRSRRLVSGALRRALVVRDRGCTFPACDRPARWSDAHHLRHWAHGGGTDLDNLALLCGHHHRVIHDEESGWQVQMGADGHPEFVPPIWLDSARAPRRNNYHPRL